MESIVPPPSSDDAPYDLAAPGPAPGPSPEQGPATTGPAGVGRGREEAGGKRAKEEEVKERAGAGATAEGEGKKGGPRLRPSRKPVRARWAMPAWGASVLVHLGVLGGLALASVTVPEVRDKLLKTIDAAPFDTKVAEKQAEETLHIDTEPMDAPRDQEATEATTMTPGAAVGAGSGATGGGAFAGGTGVAQRAGPGLGRLGPVGNLSGLSLMPAAPTRDLGGGGLIAGDVTYETTSIGEALSQLAREILRHLALHKVTVVWLFDESGSMKDDQKAVREKFDRVVADLKLGGAEESARGKDRKGPPPLSHVVVGFGRDLHYELEKPTGDIAAIGRAIDRLHVDETGIENTNQAIQAVIGHYGKLITKDHKLLIVLATDEAGDDGSQVEEARQLAINRGVPIYVLGRQSLFGYPYARIRYVDPVTKDVYWPTIRRGPETADIEVLQWDGYHERWDEIPSGFAPYELARLAKDTGGIFFLVPTVEGQRNVQHERLFSMATLKEYLPEYEGRAAYYERRSDSELRRSIAEVITSTKDSKKFWLEQNFPVNPEEMLPRAAEWAEKATAQRDSLIVAEKHLRRLEKLRDREPERRWQAHYDLILAQVVARQIKIHEYRACLLQMMKKPPTPSELPRDDLAVYWHLDHSHDRVAPRGETDKAYAEAERLLRLVMERHPDTPWAALAKSELDRGLGTGRYEHKHRPNSPQYNERAKFVPRF